MTIQLTKTGPGDLKEEKIISPGEEHRIVNLKGATLGIVKGEPEGGTFVIQKTGDRYSIGPDQPVSFETEVGDTRITLESTGKGSSKERE